MLIFRQLFDPQSSTYTYLLGDGRAKEAVLIDPVFELAPRDAALLVELGLKLVCTLETHVHADHVTGAWMMKRRFGSQIALSADSGAEGADRYLAHGDRVAFGSRHLVVRATPGHTRSCVTYVLDDESMAFTGDCLLIRGSGRTDFQQGDPHALYRSVHSQILTLPQACLLYPAHDYRGLTVTSVAEERTLQPAPGRRDQRGRFHRLHEQSRPAASEEDGHRGAGQPAVRPARRATRSPTSRRGHRSPTRSPASGRSHRSRWRKRRRRWKSSTCASPTNTSARSATSAARS